MPNFKKSDGFALGGSPFTMKKGSKEINTDGSFRQEAMGKMGSYGSPLFAIEGRRGRGDGSQVDTTSDLGADVEAGLAQGKEIAGALGLDEDEEDSPVDQTMQALTADKAKDAFKNSGSMATNSLTEGIIK